MPGTSIAPPGQIGIAFLSCKTVRHDRETVPLFSGTMLVNDDSSEKLSNF
jgi:hypothetical protein